MRFYNPALVHPIKHQAEQGAERRGYEKQPLKQQFNLGYDRNRRENIVRLHKHLALFLLVPDKPADSGRRGFPLFCHNYQFLFCLLRLNAFQEFASSFFRFLFLRTFFKFFFGTKNLRFFGSPRKRSFRDAGNFISVHAKKSYRFFVRPQAFFFFRISFFFPKGFFFLCKFNTKRKKKGLMSWN